MLRRSHEIPISQWMRKPSISTILNELHDPISLTTNPETLKLYTTTRNIPVFTRNENSCGNYISQNQPEQKVTLQYNDLHNHDWVRGLCESHAYNSFSRRPRRPALNTTPNDSDDTSNLGMNSYQRIRETYVFFARSPSTERNPGSQSTASLSI